MTVACHPFCVLERCRKRRLQGKKRLERMKEAESEKDDNVISFLAVSDCNDFL